MPLEKVEEILTVLGYKAEDVPDAAAFKTKLEADFVPRNAIPKDIVKQITGKMVGSTITDIKKLSGVEWNEELEKNPLEDIIKTIWQKREDKFTAEISTLKEQIGQPNEALSKAQSENVKLQKKIEDATVQATSLANEYNTYKESSEKKWKEEKLLTAKEKSRSTHVKFIEKLPEVAKEGYFYNLDKDYQWDFDDKGELMPLDKEGKMIPKPGVVNQFMKPEDVYEVVGIKKNTWPINNLARSNNQIIAPARESNEPPIIPAGNRRVIAKPIT